MIPYFQLTTFNIGPIPLQVWGSLVALGILVGTFVSAERARKQGLEREVIWDMAAWVLISSFLVARIFNALFYDLARHLEDPLAIFRIWEGGFSIAGGFVGAVIGGLIYIHFKKIKFWDYIDAAIYGLPLGLFIGRIGCFLIHDHPGKITNFFLGVKYPNGLIRFDHGLLLSINGLLLFLLFYIMTVVKLEKGTYAAVFLIWYGLVRFFLDFLRATDGAIVDNRFLGLTPAQYLSIIMVACGVWIFVRIKKVRTHNK